MNTSLTKFVDAHSVEWAPVAFNMTRDYFLWMNAKIEETCNFSISDVVGLSLEEYIVVAANNICPKDQTNAKYYLLIDNENAVSMGGLRTLPNGDAEVVRIYTKPECRGRGYGSMMVKQLISDASQSGFKKLKLDTGVFMQDAHKVYTAHGFTNCLPYDGAEPPQQLLPYWIFMELDLKI